MAAEYVTVFEAGLEKHDTIGLSALAVGLALIVVSVLLIINRQRLEKHHGREHVILFTTVFFIFSVTWTIWIATLDEDPHGILKAYREGRFEVVEGAVESFKPMPDYGYKDESFTVNGREFSYSSFEATVGFNHTSSKGGPIEDGIFVRVSHVGNAIVKPEVLESKD